MVGNKLANKRASYFFQKNGVYHFCRRVPVQLQRHYVTTRISFSLKTKTQKVALARARELAARLDEQWFHLQMQEDAVFGKYLKLSTFRPSVVNAVMVPEVVGEFLTNGLFRLCD